MRLAVFVVCGVGASASKRAVSERTSKPGGKALRLRLGACCSVALPPLRPEGETLGGEGRERQPKLQRKLTLLIGTALGFSLSFAVNYPAMGQRKA